jgi:SMC interacting uncharacterized protein involved in chromosome segregation
MTIEIVAMWAGWIVIISAAVVVIWKVIKPILNKAQLLIHKLELFTRDWFGEDASPGRDRVPGVMERLNNIDGELKHNGGSTMKDSIKRIENNLKAIDSRLKEGDERFIRLEEKLDNK